MFEVGWWELGVIKKSLQKQRKGGWGKAEIVDRGGDLEYVTPLPRKILIVHNTHFVISETPL